MGTGVPESVERGTGANGLTPAVDPPEPVLRALEERDVEEVARIEQAVFSTPWKAATFVKLLRGGETDLFVLDHPAEGIIGYAVLWCVRDQAELANIAVVERWRGRGLGSRLLDAVLERARARRVRSLFLEVRVSNRRASDMYAARGFEEIARRRDYYDHPREDARVLVKRLEVD